MSDRSTALAKGIAIIPAERIERAIRPIRGQEFVFDAIRALMEPPEPPPKKPVGHLTERDG